MNNSSLSVVATVVQFGGSWFGALANLREGYLFLQGEIKQRSSINFITEGCGNKETAVEKTKQVALKVGIIYKENALVFHKPVVTIWKVDEKTWVPAKVFDDRTEGAGCVTTNKADAIAKAKLVAAQLELDFSIEIANSLFGE